VNCFAPGEGAPVSLRIGGYVGSRGCLDVLEKIKMCWYCQRSGRDRPVDMATRCGLDGPGIESRLGRDFPYPSRPSLGPIQPLVQGDRVSLPGVRRLRRGVDHQHHLAPRLNFTLEQAFVACSRVKFTFCCQESNSVRYS
jgi:hypothetical protein